jgi:hypothetical protein
MASWNIVLEWLKDAGTYAVRREDVGPLGLRVDVLISGATVGVRATHSDRREFRTITWSELEHAKSNPLLKLIDETMRAVRAAE